MCGPVGMMGVKADVEDDIQARIFPFLVAQEAPDMFCYHDCQFVVQRSKDATAR